MTEEWQYGTVVEHDHLGRRMLIGPAKVGDAKLDDQGTWWESLTLIGELEGTIQWVLKEFNGWRIVDDSGEQP